MTLLTILKENLTRKTFLVELSRARAKGAQLVTNLVTFAWAPFHSIKTSGLKFWQLPCSTEWNSIFAIYTQIFENYHREVFFPHSTLLPNVKIKFVVEWFAFRISFRKSGSFSGKILYQLPLFLKFIKFWVNGKRPKCLQEIWVLKQSSARTTMCKKVCCTCKLNLLTLALLITSPG